MATAGPASGTTSFPPPPCLLRPLKAAGLGRTVVQEGQQLPWDATAAATTMAEEAAAPAPGPPPPEEQQHLVMQCTPTCLCSSAPPPSAAAAAAAAAEPSAAQWLLRLTTWTQWSSYGNYSFSYGNYSLVQ